MGSTHNAPPNYWLSRRPLIVFVVVCVIQKEEYARTLLGVCVRACGYRFHFCRGNLFTHILTLILYSGLLLLLFFVFYPLSIFLLCTYGIYCLPTLFKPFKYIMYYIINVFFFFIKTEMQQSKQLKSKHS